MCEVTNRIGLLETEQLLLSGGDVRLRLEAGRGVNKYGCSPLPTPALAAFGSSTATTISESGFAAADGLRDSLLARLEGESPELVYEQELNRIRQELMQLSGVADLPGLETIIAASGTDVHLIAAQLAAGSMSTSTLVIMMAATETGSGVEAALRGQHFSTRSARGVVATEGAALTAGCGITVVQVPLRLADGSLRPVAEVDAEVSSLLADATSRGQRGLLIAIDVSKTGLIAPSTACIAGLRRTLPESVDVMVDACQFRIAPATLRAYLESGCMVALTGSKFVTGPAFSGALLVPSLLASRLRQSGLPGAMSAYSTCAEWPRDWAASRLLDVAVNFGLLLRWEAALAELRAFRRLPDLQVASIACAFSDAVQRRLSSDSAFELLPAPAIDRRPMIDADCWDRTPTIFPFLLYRNGPGRARVPLTREQTLAVYHLLQSDVRVGEELIVLGDEVQLGQPVPCGKREGVEISALRLCLSSRLIVEAASTDAIGLDKLIQQAMAALDRTAALVNATAY